MIGWLANALASQPIRTRASKSNIIGFTLRWPTFLTASIGEGALSKAVEVVPFPLHKIILFSFMFFFSNSSEYHCYYNKQSNYININNTYIIVNICLDFNGVFVPGFKDFSSAFRVTWNNEIASFQQS